jgi:AraC-like DNA-binding protein
MEITQWQPERHRPATPGELLFAVRLPRIKPAASSFHQHADAWQVEHVIAGRVRCEVGEAEHLLGAGSLIAIPPGYPHRQEVPAGTDSYMLRFALAGIRPGDRPIVLHLASADAGTAARLMQSLVFEHDGRAPAREAMIDALLQQFVIWLRRWDAGAGALTTGSSDLDARSRVRRVGDLIRREYAQRFAVGELAKAACLSRSRFMELFREEFGTSPGEFHRHVQTEKAVELARYTGMSWQQIALHLGYADASHFSRVFKRVMGLPPSEYLARMRDAL